MRSVPERDRSQGPARTPLVRDEAARFAEHRRARRPVALRGADFPAFAKWSFDALAASFDSEGRIVSGLPLHGNPYECDSRAERRGTRLRDLLPLLREPSRDRPCYFLTSDTPPAFRDDVPFGTIDPEAREPHDVTLWAGSAGTRSGLHFDYADNFLAQIRGTKHVILAGPEQGACFYPRPSYHCNSGVDSDAPDLDRYPRFAEATFYEGILGPGEVLFIPAGYWHAIRALEDSISVNCFFGPQLPITHHARVIGMGGARNVARVLGDAVWHGVLKRPYLRELYTPASTGHWMVIMAERRLRAEARAARDKLRRVVAR